jgi:1-acyl-sn-glycerol-3-phosphate acyltransferase
MTRPWLIVRSTFLWAVSLLHFGIVVPLVLLLAAIVGQRRVDFLVRLGARNIVRLAGARLKVTLEPGFDRSRTCFLVSNHVNVFDPFVLYAAVGLPFRGLELESHFKVPIYGWLMKRFGNVPVPDVRTPSGLKRTYRLAGEALERGTCLMVFAEGSRTLDGRVGPFEDGVFRMAIQLGFPITPVSLVNSFAWQNKLSKLLRPATVHVHVHETIDVKGLTRKDLDGLRERVRAIVAAPVEAALPPDPPLQRAGSQRPSS